MKEGDAYLARVIERARYHGWRAWQGLALILLHDDPPRMIIAEVKGDGGSLTDEQQEFLRLARDVAEDAYTLYEGIAGNERVLGVYVFTPDNEQAVDDMLRTKVLT